MTLHEYFCETCQVKFEQIVSASEMNSGKCPKCHGLDTKKLLSLFSIGGRGDLRESTMHGCEECYTGIPGQPGRCHTDEESD
jgi:putative FmdB family regulatory protein